MKNAPIAAFAPHERLPQDSGSNAPNVICLANEARFTAAYFSEPLTSYAVGWKDPNNIMGTLDFLFPPVQVGRRFEYKSATNAEEFLSETDDVRAIGSDFKRVTATGTSVLSKTINKGLTIRLDMDEAVGINSKEKAVGRLMRRLQRSELRRAIAAVVAAATNSAKTWDTTAGKDPDQDVRSSLITGATASGIRANRILYGDTAWDKRGLSHRAQVTAGGIASAQLSPEQLAGILGVRGIQVSYERYQSSATAKTEIVNNLVIQFWAEDGLSEEDPSHTKRFWTPCAGGEMFRVYEQEVSSKFIDITVEHYSNVVASSSLGLRTLTIS